MRSPGKGGLALALAVTTLGASCGSENSEQVNHTQTTDQVSTKSSLIGPSREAALELLCPLQPGEVKYVDGGRIALEASGAKIFDETCIDIPPGGRKHLVLPGTISHCIEKGALSVTYAVAIPSRWGPSFGLQHELIDKPPADPCAGDGVLTASEWEAYETAKQQLERERPEPIIEP